MGSGLDAVWVVVGAVQGLGILGLVASRLGERTDWAHLGRWLFALTFLLVSATTVASLAVGCGDWAISGTTLSLMVVGATLDCGRWERDRAGQ